MLTQYLRNCEGNLTKPLLLHPFLRKKQCKTVSIWYRVGQFDGSQHLTFSSEHLLNNHKKPFDWGL